MRSKLTDLGIPADSLNAALEFLNTAPNALLSDLCVAFGLTPKLEDTLPTARFIADAAVRLGDGGSVEKVVSHVRRKMLGIAPPPPAPVRVVGPTVKTIADVVIAPVVEVKADAVEVEASPVVTPYAGRGRRRNGNSDFCKAVAIIEATGSAERGVRLAALLAAGYNKSSAGVYLWKYNSGARD